MEGMLPNNTGWRFLRRGPYGPFAKPPTPGKTPATTRRYASRMDGIGWAASAMSAARTRLDVAAENLANGSRDGFRKRLLRASLTASGVRMRSVQEDAPGPLRHTGRQFDLAIEGRGAFRVRDARGRIALTRSGAFSRDRFGRLVDTAGRVLVGTQLAPGSSVRHGFLEASNVDAIGEMIDLMSAQRSFETAQKVLSAIDQTRERAATQVAAVKG